MRAIDYSGIEGAKTSMRWSRGVENMQSTTVGCRIAKKAYNIPKHLKIYRSLLHSFKFSM